MARRITTILAAGAAAAVLALGVSACGDDDDDGGSTAAGGSGDESALAQLCSDLAELDDVTGALAGLDPDTATSDDTTRLNAQLGGVTDSLGMAATGAGIDLGPLDDSLATLQTTIQEADPGSGSPTPDQIAAIQAAAADVAEQAEATEREYCADETGASAPDGS